MSGKASKPSHMLGKMSYEVRASTRKPIHPSDVRDALLKAAAAAAEVEKEHFKMPDVWLSLRPTFHALREDERRLVLLRLLIEEGARLGQEEGMRFHPHAHEGQR